jgi:hypothetical protein
MSGGAWLGLVLFLAFVSAILLMIGRLVWFFLTNEEPVSGGSWGRQLFGRRRGR